MKQTRREFLRGAVGWGGLLLAGSFELAATGRAEPIRRAHRYLAAQQSADGGWRSERYAAFREGDVLTPVVLWAMQMSEESSSDPGFTRGVRWLERFTDTLREREDPWQELRYPLFTASYATQVLARSGDPDRADVWIKLIRALRTGEELGWPAQDPMCGAWSDAARPPRYVAPVPDMLAPNISATALAVGALGVAGCAGLGLTARPFIEHCQNFADGAPGEFDDGGFFFALDDPIRNKAGSAGHDANGRTRFHSYGSATCDGYLALRACGLPQEHPRMCAAREWLRKHCDGLTAAGVWPANRTEAGASLVYYQSQALATVLVDLRLEESWSQTLGHSLVSALITKQGSDGAWQGVAPDSCEDEPLLASALALRALVLLE